MSYTSATQRRRERYGARGVEIELGGTQFTKLGASRFDWRDPYHLAVTLSWPSFIAAVIGVHLMLNVLFGIGYTLMPGSVANARPGSFLDAFFFSVETLATVGYGVMAPQNLPGHVLSSFEIVVGMGYTAVTTGLLFVRFSRPRSSVAYAETIVVAQRNRRPTLMLRIGNRRMTTLLDARANLEHFAS